MNERDLVKQYGYEAIFGPSTMASLTELRTVLDSGHCPQGPWRTDLLECVRMIKTSPGCTLHANSGMAICTACRKTILCMKCDSIPCQCGFVFVDEDM
jgi:hypothetical protein